MDLLPVLPIRIIAYICLFAGAAAIIVGCKSIRLQQPGPDASGMSAKSVRMSWNDVLLIGIWALAFAAGLGLLNYSPWAPGLLEYFCWVLIGLTLLSSARRVLALRDLYRKTHPDEPFMWAPAVAGALLAITPYIALAAVTLNTLHDAGVRKDLRNGRENRDTLQPERSDPSHPGSTDSGNAPTRN